MNFEKLALALARSALGPTVEAFGSGPDGGREATYRGRFTASDGEIREGYVVIQAKQRQNDSTDRDSNLQWLQRELKKEFDAWSSPSSTSGPIPDYIIFVTNVTLSAVAQTGGIDKIRAYLDHLTLSVSEKKPGMGAQVWHRDYVETALDTEDGIRNAFPGILTTTSDILTKLTHLLPSTDPEAMAKLMVAGEAQVIQQERWVNFSEAGADSRTEVQETMVDLPVRTADTRSSALSEVVREGDLCRRPSLSSKRLRGLVVTGSPGNGKSTLARFIAQYYRSHLLPNEGIPTSALRIAQSTKSAGNRLDLGSPENRRWPLLISVVDLVTNAERLNLLQFVADRLNERLDVTVSGSWVKAWLKSVHTIIILDGLDEVTSSRDRRLVMDAIERCVELCEEQDADSYFLVTTRTTGYTDGDRLDPELFAEIELDYLNHKETLEYATRVTRLRLADDPRRQQLVLGRFEQSMAESSGSSLAQTPLQILITTVLLERRGALPKNNYLLFWQYYEIMATRERAKTTALASFITDNYDAITAIHEMVGLALQRRAERDGGALPVLHKEELRRLAEIYWRDQMLWDEGSRLNQVVDRFVEASLKRLVLLVSNSDDGVGFELRSLQEVMAARALSQGTDDELRQVLVELAPSPHWRNVWVFIAGRVFSESL